MKNWMKRGLSLLLVMAMVFGFIPMGMVTSAKAAEEGKATLLQDAAGTALMYDICYFTGRTAWAGALLLLRKKAITVSPVTVGFTVSPEASTT